MNVSVGVYIHTYQTILIAIAMIRQYFLNVRILAVTEIILKLRVLVLMPFLTREFGTINYGVWSQMSVIATTITPLIFLGTGSAVQRYLPGKPLGIQKQQFSAWVIYLITMAGIFCLPLLIFREQAAKLFFGATTGYVDFLPLAVGALFSGALLNAVRNWYLVQNNAKFFSFTNIAQSTLITFAAILVLIFNKSVYELVVLVLVSDMLLLLVTIAFISLQYGWSRPDFSILFPLLKYGLPLVPAGFAMWGLNYIDRLFLLQYSSLSDIGVYSVAYSLGNLVILLLFNPFWTMFPRSASELYNKGDLDVLQRLFDRSVGSALTLSVPAVAGLMIFSIPLLTLFTTQEFSVGGPLVPLLTIGNIFLMLAAYYQVALGLVHRQYLVTISIFIAFLVNVLLNTILVPRYLILGASIATTLAYCMQFIISYLFASRYKLLATKTLYLMKVLAASSIMYLALSIFQFRSFWELALGVSSGLILYVLLMFLMRAIDKSEIIVAAQILGLTKSDPDH